MSAATETLILDAITFPADENKPEQGTDDAAKTDKSASNPRKSAGVLYAKGVAIGLTLGMLLIPAMALSGWVGEQVGLMMNGDNALIATAE